MRLESVSRCIHHPVEFVPGIEMMLTWIFVPGKAVPLTGISEPDEFVPVEVIHNLTMIIQMNLES